MKKLILSIFVLCFCFLPTTIGLSQQSPEPAELCDYSGYFINEGQEFVCTTGSLACKAPCAKGSIAIQ